MLKAYSLSHAPIAIDLATWDVFSAKTEMYQIEIQKTAKKPTKI
jgi:hypothetical protein